MLKAVWSFGLNLPWPIDARRDLGKLPRTRRGESPSDGVMAAWKEAISHEPNLHLQLEWLLIAQHGWRPSHVTRLRWRNVRYNEAGKPVAIVADGSQEGFKTSSPIVARLAPDVMEALDAWRKVTPEPLPDRPILPWGSAVRKADPSRGQSPTTVTRHWKLLQKRWRLPPLRPVDVRHWVAGACRRADLSKQASAYLMGHDPTQGGAMRDWYDNPQIEDVLAEQAEKLPHGPLGMLGHGAVELIEGMPSDAVPLMFEYLAGQIGTMEFATRAEAIRLRGSIGQASRPER
jgi:integrase